MKNKNIPISYSVASWTGIFDRKKLKWNESILNSISLESSNLPELKSYDFSLQGLSDRYNKRWKNLKNSVFFLPVGDGVSSNLGVGCNSEGKIALSIGTTGALRVLTRKTNLKIPQGLWAYKLNAESSLIGGAFSEGGNVGLWLKKLMNMQENSEEIDNVEFNKELEQLLLRSKPDGHGLTVLPFLAGERAVGWAKRMCTQKGCPHAFKRKAECTHARTHLDHGLRLLIRPRRFETHDMVFPLALVAQWVVAISVEICFPEFFPQRDARLFRRTHPCRNVVLPRPHQLLGGFIFFSLLALLSLLSFGPLLACCVHKQTPPQGGLPRWLA